MDIVKGARRREKPGMLALWATLWAAYQARRPRGRRGAGARCLWWARITAHWAPNRTSPVSRRMVSIR